MPDIPNNSDCPADEQPTAVKCDNDKRYYYSASSFKQVDENSREYKKRQELFEYGVDTQCDESGCGSQGSLSTRDPYITCYICGKEIRKSKGDFHKDPDGSQCEHVLTATTIAMLCGLSNSAYTDLINDIKESYGSSNNNLDTFLEFRELLIRKGNDQGVDSNDGGGKRGIVYKWSHPACNLIKNEYPFIVINFTKDGPKIVENPTNKGKACNSIDYVLEMLWLNKDDHRSKEYRKEFDGDEEEYCNNDAMKEYVEDRKQKIEKDILEPIKTNIKKYSTKLPLFSAISMHMLCEIIKSKLMNSKTFKSSPLGLALKLSNTFKNILKEGYGKMDESLREYLQSRDKAPLQQVVKNGIIGLIEKYTKKKVPKSLSGGARVANKDRLSLKTSVSELTEVDEGLSEDTGISTELVVQGYTGEIESIDKINYYKQMINLSFNNYIHEAMLSTIDEDNLKYIESLSYQSNINKSLLSIFVGSNIESDEPEAKLPIVNKKAIWTRPNKSSRLQRIDDSGDTDVLNEIYNYTNMLYMLHNKMNNDLKKDSLTLEDNPEPYTTLEDIDQVGDGLLLLLADKGFIQSIEDENKLTFLKGKLKHKKKVKKSTRKRGKNKKERSKNKKKRSKNRKLRSKNIKMKHNNTKNKSKKKKNKSKNKENNSKTDKTKRK